MVINGGGRVWFGRCELGGQCCLEKGHTGECNDGNMSDQEYEVECITAEKMVRKRKVYRVKWKGWPDQDSTWENASSLADAKKCLEEWTKRLKKTAMAKLEESKPAATEAEVTEAEEKEEVVLTDTEAGDTEPEEAEPEGAEAEKTEPASQEVVEARTDKVAKAAAVADARAAAVDPQVDPSMTSPVVETLCDLQADADVWLSVLEEVALLREGAPKRTTASPTSSRTPCPFRRCSSSRRCARRGASTRRRLGTRASGRRCVSAAGLLPCRWRRRAITALCSRRSLSPSVASKWRSTKTSCPTGPTCLGRSASSSTPR